MTHYQHILLAADFSDHGAQVAARAAAIAKQCEARLSVVHVVDNLPLSDAAYGPLLPLDVELTDVLLRVARDKLSALAKEYGIAENDQWLELGNPKDEIIRVAKEQGVDLIVAGSHGRRGLALLLGSTVDGILHHATCDVLAVRLQQD